MTKNNKDSCHDTGQKRKHQEESKTSEYTRPKLWCDTPEQQLIKKRKFACSYRTENGPCQKEFDAKSNLTLHIRTHTGEKPYKCTKCVSSFAQSVGLEVHMRTHTGEKPYKCTACDSAFSQQSTLEVHLRNHSGEKPYKCTKCVSTFSSSSSLAKHKRTHTGEKPYKCSKCESSFSQSGSLEVHMRTHTGEKPYKCSICQNSFSQTGGLEVHMRTHTGEKPYKCTKCDSAFTIDSNLTTHMRTHTGEKPYKCTKCESAFYKKGDLTTHMRTHTGERPFHCLDLNCDAAFARSGNAKKHYQSMHSDEAAMNKRKKEQRLAATLEKAGITFERNPWITFNCNIDKGKKGAWLDYAVYKENHIFIIECDERQHDEKHGNPFGYTLSCELARMSRVQEALTINGTENDAVPSIVWIRYNPDAFFVDDVRKSTKITQKIREERLVDVLSNFVPNQTVTVLYMFYDCKTVDGKLRPSILDEEDFDELFATFVVDPIVK